MGTMNAYLEIAAAGVSIRGPISRTTPGMIGQEVTLAAGVAGVLTTRSDNDTGVVTVASHDITVSDTVDVFWTSAGILYCHYGMTVTGADGTTVSIDGGTRDNLPLASSAVVICKQQTVDLDFDGDLLELLVAAADQDCHFTFLTGADADVVAGGVLLPANEPWMVWDRRGVTDLFDGEVTASLKIANGTVTAATWKLIVGYDSDG